jgi:orotate phosphoribosyltransferase
MEPLILDLYTKNCIKFGDFTLKNGTKSSIYIDLKNIISHPYLINNIAEKLYSKIKTVSFDRICGIPYGAIPVSAVIAFNHNIPLLLIRKETKTYGLRKLIEGEFNAGDKIVIVEDTITTGSSILKFIALLKQCQLKVKKILVICDRRENPDALLDGYEIDSLVNFAQIQLFLRKHLFIEKLRTLPSHTAKSQALINIMETKMSNICLSITKDIELENYLDKICILKIDNTIFQYGTIQKIIHLSQKHGFMLMDSTVFSHNQKDFFNLFTKGNKLHEWVDLIIIRDTSLAKLMPVCDKINRKIGIVIEHTELDISIINLIVEKYNKYVVGILNYNNCCDTNLINFSKNILYIIN